MQSSLLVSLTVNGLRVLVGRALTQAWQRIGAMPGR